jgi:predicted dehydrogenase
LDNRIKFAILGIGRIGKRHAELIKGNEESDLVGLIDCRPYETLGIDKYKIPFFSSLEHFLDSNIECDVVSIATPNGLHAKQAIACLVNKKHVIVEKPLALTSEDARSVIFTSREVNKNVFTVMQNRYSPPSIWLKNIVKSGILGKLYMVQLNCYWNRDKRYYKPDSWHGTKSLDGGTLFTQFSHFIDMLNWVFGDIQNISSRITNFNHKELTEFEDSGIVNFEFVTGGICSFSFSTSVWDKNLESSLTIIAEKGSVQILGQYMEEIKYCHIENYRLPQLTATQLSETNHPGKGNAGNHQHVIENVVDVLKGRSLSSSEPEQAIKVIDIIERIYRNNSYLSTAQ